MTCTDAEQGDNDEQSHFVHRTTPLSREYAPNAVAVQAVARRRGPECDGLLSSVDPPIACRG